MFSLRYRLKRTFVWFRRFTHLKGNGIQSPFAYNFLCEVINNTSQYYAYDDLKPQLSALSLQQRKQAKLLFRLANWQQPSTIILPTSLEHFKPFLLAGCPKAEILLESKTITNGKSFLLVVDKPESLTSDMSQQAASNNLVVVTGIGSPRSNRKIWKSITTEAWATLTFDLYHTGLILFHPTLHKHHYIVNF